MHLSLLCSSQSLVQPLRLSHLHFPGHKLHTRPGLCEHGVCFARVTCLIISFSGGRLFLVSTVTAPLRGEAIRQRVKQVIKTLKPCARWEGGRASGTQRDETGRARGTAGSQEPGHGDTSSTVSLSTHSILPCPAAVCSGQCPCHQRCSPHGSAAKAELQADRALKMRVTFSCIFFQGCDWQNL